MSIFESFVCRFEQEYPLFSSKTVDGEALWSRTRSGKSLDKMPTKQVTIYGIDLVSISKIPKDQLESLVNKRIGSVSGDFRQDKIKKEWQKTFKNSTLDEFSIISLRVRCSSGTYMRILANKIGERLGISALAWRIRRIKIGDYGL